VPDLELFPSWPGDSNKVRKVFPTHFGVMVQARAVPSIAECLLSDFFTLTAVCSTPARE
jgi:hypothetical protein